MRKRKKWTEGAAAFAFSIESFADAHEIGRSSVYEEIKSGRLKARKVNSRTITPSRTPPPGAPICRPRQKSPERQPS